MSSPNCKNLRYGDVSHTNSRKAETVLTSLTRGHLASNISRVAPITTSGSALAGHGAYAASCSDGTEQTLPVRMRGSQESAPASKARGGTNRPRSRAHSKEEAHASRTSIKIRQSHKEDMQIGTYQLHQSSPEGDHHKSGSDAVNIQQEQRDERSPSCSTSPKPKNHEVRKQ